MMLGSRPCGFVKKIETQTVFLQNSLLKEPVPEFDPVPFPQYAFEQGLLDTLPVVLTGLRYTAEPAPSLFGFRGYVVGHHHDHVTTSTHKAHRIPSLPGSPAPESSPANAAADPPWYCGPAVAESPSPAYVLATRQRRSVGSRPSSPPRPRHALRNRRSRSGGD